MRSALLLVLLVLLVTLVFTDVRLPCQRSRSNNTYDHFKDKHILSYDFDTASRDAWAEYLTEKGLCGSDRPPLQFFLRKNSKYSIRNICNGEGFIYRRNFCISLRKFTVYIVTVNSTSVNNQQQCVVETLEEKVRFVVVACDVIGDECLPVLYKRQTNTPPDLKGRRCHPRTHWYSMGKGRNHFRGYRFGK